ncbi:MAG: M23 family metallopeptidase [Candidatus Saccharicenans sp.]
MRKGGIFLWFLGCIFVFVFLFSRFLHSNMSIIGHWDCVEVTTSYAWYNPDDGEWYLSKPETSYQCTYVIDNIIFDDEDDSTGGASDGDSGDDSEPGGPGGGMGPTQPNVYDTNNDGYIDCYNNVIMRMNGLFISSNCDEIRQKEDGSTYIHGAWDITGPGVDGANIYAAASGEVIYVGVQTTTQTDKITGQKITYISGYGYYVMIKDDAGNIWIYAHLKG